MINPLEIFETNKPRYSFREEILPRVREKAEKAQGFWGDVADKFASPLKDKYNITQKFGNYNPSLYKGITKDSRHKGLDLATPLGTELFSPIAGKVKSGFDKNWGNYVDVVADDGTTYRFSHLSALERIADQVQPGQLLGKTGSSGHSTGAHLDISVRRGGQFIDPLTISALAAALGEG